MKNKINHGGHGEHGGETPETDAEITEVIMFSTVSAKFARKLERERDKALALAEERKGYLENSIEEYEELRLSYQRIYRERDALQEQNAKLRDIADRCLVALQRAFVHIPESSLINFHIAFSTLRAELDQLKEGAK